MRVIRLGGPILSGDARLRALGNLARLLGDRGRERGANGSSSRIGRPGSGGWRRWRRHSRRLPASIGDRHDVGRVVDHDRVVDVVEDHIVRRWRSHVDRRANPNWNRAVYRDRQHEEGDRGWGRREQHHELRRPGREENHRRRRWRHEREYRVVENENAAFDVNELIGRRRWHLVIDGGKRRRRLQHGCEE